MGIFESGKNKDWTNLDDVAPGTPSALPVPIAEGGTAATTPMQARINLGVPEFLGQLSDVATGLPPAATEAGKALVWDDVAGMYVLADVGDVDSTRAINTTGPLVGGGDLTADRTISIPQATGTVDGYLDAADHVTFSAKVDPTRTLNTTAPLQGGGDLSADRTLSMPAANGATDGYLTSTDWTVFNGHTAAIAGNDADIAALQAEQTVQNTAIAGNDTDIAALQAEQLTQNTAIAGNDTDIAALQAQQVTQNTAIAGNDTDIAALQTEQTTQNTAITANTTAIAALPDLIVTTDGNATGVTLSGVKDHTANIILVGNDGTSGTNILQSAPNGGIELSAETVANAVVSGAAGNQLTVDGNDLLFVPAPAANTETDLVLTTDGNATGVALSGTADHTVNITLLGDNAASGVNLLASAPNGGVELSAETIVANIISGDAKQAAVVGTDDLLFVPTQFLAETQVAFGSATDEVTSNATMTYVNDQLILQNGLSPTSRGSGTNSEQWGQGVDSSGASAIGLGRNLAVSGPSSIGVGSGSVVGATSVGIGINVSVPGFRSTHVGFGSIGTSLQSVGVGYLTSAGNQGVAVGTQAAASGTAGVAVGIVAEAGSESIAIGRLPKAFAARCIQIGSGTNNASFSTVLGNGTQNDGPQAILIGDSVVGGAAADYGIAIGFESRVDHFGSVALGYGASSFDLREFSLGSDDTQIDSMWLGRGHRATINPGTDFLLALSESTTPDQNGGTLTIRGGAGTGILPGGPVRIQTAPAGLVSGAVINTAVDRFEVTPEGSVKLFDLPAAPTPPTGGFLLYSQGGQLVAMGASGVPTILAV